MLKLNFVEFRSEVESFFNCSGSSISFDTPISLVSSDGEEYFIVFEEKFKAVTASIVIHIRKNNSNECYSKKMNGDDLVDDVKQASKEVINFISEKTSLFDDLDEDNNFVLKNGFTNFPSTISKDGTLLRSFVPKEDGVFKLVRSCSLNDMKISVDHNGNVVIKDKKNNKPTFFYQVNDDMTKFGLKSLIAS